MTVYKVAVASLDGVVYQSESLADFSSAKSELIDQLLTTGREDYGVDVEDIEKIVSQAENLTEEKFGFPMLLGQYVHIIIDAELEIPWDND